MKDYNNILRSLTNEQREAIDWMNNNNLETMIAHLAKFEGNVKNPLTDLLAQYGLKIVKN